MSCLLRCITILDAESIIHLQEPSIRSRLVRAEFDRRNPALRHERSLADQYDRGVSIFLGETRPSIEMIVRKISLPHCPRRGYNMWSRCKTHVSMIRATSKMTARAGGASLYYAAAHSRSERLKTCSRCHGHLGVGRERNRVCMEGPSCVTRRAGCTSVQPVRTI
jgi:cytochrome c553